MQQIFVLFLHISQCFFCKKAEYLKQLKMTTNLNFYYNIYNITYVIFIFPHICFYISRNCQIFRLLLVKTTQLVN